MSIPYATRISARARHPQIRILPPGRVEVVIPRGMPASVAGTLIASKHDWVRRKLAQFAVQVAESDASTHPESIHLAAVDRHLPVKYRANGAAGVRATTREGMLTLSGAIDDASRVRLALRRWLLTHARTELPPMLQDLSADHGLAFRQVTVRFQKSRWGSCSAQRHISLNARLLCLPAGLARHVMLHELAHLRHLNHSGAFWALLRRLDPDTDRHHAALRTAWLQLPAWLAADSAL
jgi:hypothetical protein